MGCCTLSHCFFIIYFSIYIFFVVGCVRVMDAGSVNSSPSSSSSTSRYLKSQSRFPLQEQFLQRKKPRENVISYIFSFSFVYISVIALLFYPFVSIALFLVPSCFKFHFFTWVFYNLIFEIRFLRIENSDFCPEFQFLKIFFFFFTKSRHSISNCSFLSLLIFQMRHL